MKKDKEEESKVRYKSLIVEGTKYKTHYNKKFENVPKWEKVNPKKITSFIPGAVVKILVSKGKKVKEGDNLLIYEAMKMQNQVKAPMDGTVKDIYVKEGEKIAKGFLMVELV
jgi:biotin carboxyl carrier protein